MDFSKLDSYMDKMPLCGIPACELSVSKDGEFIYRKGVGFSDSEGTKPVSCHDLYWIFSATKVITCIAAMRLVESGELSLSAPVSKYIPEFANMKVLQKDGTLTDAQNIMTVEHLFTMCGGMTYEVSDPIIKEAAAKTPATLDIVRSMAKMPLVFEPGTKYKYSLCHDVLAAIIEVITGMKYSEYLQKYIFTPLGITDMGFRPTDEQKSRFSAQYIYENGTGKARVIPTHNKFILSPEYDSGGAGLFSSVDEYMKIISVIACGGTTSDGYTILKPETIRMMGENRLSADCLNNFVSTRFYGYGWGLCGRAHFDPVRSASLSPVGEFGWDGAAAAFVMIDPTNRISLYFGTHVFGSHYAYHMIHPTIRNMVYEALEN